MSTKKVAVFASSFLDEPVARVPGTGKGAAILSDLVKSNSQVQVEFRCDRSPSEPARPDELAGVTAVIADLERYEADVLRKVGIGKGGSLELIARYGVGYDAVDIEAATDAGVLVTNAPGANTTPTAEWTVATLLDIAGRRLPNHERAATGQGKFPSPRLDVSEKTLGVVGTGAVGRTVVRLLSGFGMKILAYDPYQNSEWATAAGARYVTLVELLAESDFVTLHAATTERIIGPTEIALMRPTCVLVNCARGTLVDNRAVHEAVSSGRLFGYGLDEIWHEPDLPLTGLNITVSPHVGSDTDAGKVGMQVMSAQSVADYLEGRTPAYVLNPDAREHRAQR